MSNPHWTSKSPNNGPPSEDDVADFCRKAANKIGGDEGVKHLQTLIKKEYERQGLQHHDQVIIHFDVDVRCVVVPHARKN